MIFGNVDSSFAEQRSYTANDAGNIVIREDQKRIPRLDVDMKCADSREPREYARLRGSGDRDLLHSAAQSHFDGVGIVLGRSLRRRKSMPRASATARALMRLSRSCSTVPSSKPRAAEASNALLAPASADPARTSTR